MKNIKDRIINKIKAEIESNPIDDSHGISKENIEKHLIDPIIQTYFSTSRENPKTLSLWTVLEEDPIGKDLYKICYDEEKDSFGLGTKDDEGNLYYLGNYGSFIEALNGI